MKKNSKQLWAMEENHLRDFIMKVENPPEAAIAYQDSTENPVIVSMEGDTAILNIVGTLVKGKPSPIMRFFGFNSTSYADIISAVGSIKGTPGITRVKAVFDTPGGMVDGIDDAYQALFSLRDGCDMEAEVKGMCASGGYYLAAAFPKITSSAPTNEIGSIGVLVVYVSYKAADEKYGVKEITITSKNAPNKAPDPETKQGRNVIQDRVDAMERIFYQRISEGRGVSVKDIADRFGQGGLLVSYDPDSTKPNAMSAGMIDSVMGIKLKKQEGKKKMATLAEVVQTDPGVGLEVKGREDEAFKKGQQSGKDSANERIKRVSAFLAADAYPKAIRDLAVKVLEGTSEFSALEGAVAFYDAAKEDAALKEANTETPKDTLPAAPPAVDVTNVASENDLAALLARDKGRFGLVKEG